MFTQPRTRTYLGMYPYLYLTLTYPSLAWQVRALEKKIQEDEKAAAKVDADRQAQADSIVGLESDLDGIIQAGNEADKEAQEAKGTCNVLYSKIVQ